MNLDGTEVNLPEGEDHALDALQSADPAIGLAQPDLVAIRGKVDTSDLAQASNLSEHIARTKRFSRWSYAAAVAVVALGVGTGTGYSIAARHSGTNQQSVTLATCTADHPDCNDTPGTLAGTSPGYAAGKSSALGASAIWLGGGSAWLTPADSLSDTPSTGHGYIMSSADLDRSTAVAKLIDAFGIGAHRIRHTSAQDGTRVIENDTRTTIELASDDTTLANWYYDNPDNGQYACEENYGDRPKQDASAPCKIKTGEALSDTQALAVAKDIFGTAGLDLNNVTWETHSGKEAFGNLPYVQVVAHMTIEGQAIEGTYGNFVQWTIELAPDKSVVHASGVLAKPVQVPDYETVGAKTAVLRSQDAKWSDTYGPEPIYSSDQVIGAELGDRGVGYGSAVHQNLDNQGRPLLQIQLDQVEITEAEPTLAGFSLADSSYVILPAYKLTRGDRSWIQVSIADKYLQVN